MDLDRLAIKTIRSLSLDIVENAKHGHLGMPLGAAPMGYILFKNHIRVNPNHTDWINRDRFVLSAGHGSALLYALMHVFGYHLLIEDLKGFRKLKSKTPGHPEVGVTEGVDATTGPLGQGFAMAVGMAIAEKHLSDKFNKETLEIINHKTYAICGDGDLMEGVAIEAASLAGTLELSKLIVLYDSNDVCSDGMVIDSTSDNVKDKYHAMGWEVLTVKDGNDIKTIDEMLTRAKKSNKPTLIEVKNIIGYGSILANTCAIHSDPVGEKEALRIKKSLEWDHKEPFFIPNEIKQMKKSYLEKANLIENEWKQLQTRHREQYPKEYQELFETAKANGGEDFKRYTNPIATRSASGDALNLLFKENPNLLGGSADLASSNKTILKDSKFMNKEDASGNNIHFGVREFSMAAIINGITLHGITRGYCGTFLVFSDYMRSAIRHAALMKINPIFLFTHDSVIVGPDGPTHQPIEQLASLRVMPNLDVIRTCDGNETYYAWKYAIQNDKPTALILCRQEIPILDGTSYEKLEKGAYIISDKVDYEATLIATGSEVDLAIEVQRALDISGIKVRVVNMPSWELFDKQDSTYQNKIIDPTKEVYSLEASSGFGWERYTKKRKNIFSIDKYGESGNGQDLYDERGFTVDNIVSRYLDIRKEYKSLDINV